ncbi:MAG TPA: MAPEG family protein [Rhizomicrobium sp.]|jgi:uncharacterized MAPEG superfamily protein|nr:MAPEG family protein [Rhizomicrobium sp.]
MDRETQLAVIVTLVTVALYLGMGARVGILRGKLGVVAPAMTGHPAFERAARVHLNTGEQLIAFLPLLWMATLTFHVWYWLPAAFGAVFLLARLLYMRLYMAAPDTRIPAAFLTMLAQVGLFVLAVVGLVKAM